MADEGAPVREVRDGRPLVANQRKEPAVFRHNARPGGMLVVSAIVCALAETATAQTTEPVQVTEPALAPEVVVSATRLPTAIGEVGSSVTVITSEGMEARGHRQVLEALRGVAGLRMTQLGGPGRVTSVFARGANSNHTLVVVDGVEMSDPSAPNGAFNYAHLLSAGLDRIEVLRGPQSTLYGSDAVAGVVSMVTAPGRGRPSVSGWLEGGSNETISAGATLGGEAGRVAFAATAAALATAGESVTAARLRGGAAPEDDGYENLTGSLRLDYRLAPDSEITLTARYIQTETELDPGPEDPDAFETTQQYFARVSARALFFDGLWEPTIALAHTHHDRDNVNRPDALAVTNSVIFNSGDRNKIEWRNDLFVHPDHVLTIGVESEAERFTDLQSANFGSGFTIAGATKADVRTNALYAQDQFTLSDRLFGAIGARIDDHDRFDRELTYRVAPVYWHRETDTRLKGAIGTGFRAPALFELFGSSFNSFGGIGTGDPNLNPETSRGWEIGFEQPLLAGAATFGATYYESQIKDLVVIAFAFPDSTTVNLNEAELSGVEAFVNLAPAPEIEAQFGYTYTRAEDGATGADLLRRPRHKVDLDVRAHPWPATTISVGMIYVGGHTDITFATGQIIKRGGYAVFDFAGHYDLTPAVRMSARVENLLDRDYEVADGFRGFGRRGHLGVSARF